MLSSSRHNWFIVRLRASLVYSALFSVSGCLISKLIKLSIVYHSECVTTLLRYVMQITTLLSIFTLFAIRFTTYLQSPSKISKNVPTSQICKSASKEANNLISLLLLQRYGDFFNMQIFYTLFFKKNKTFFQVTENQGLARIDKIKKNSTFLALFANILKISTLDNFTKYICIVCVCI